MECRDCASYALCPWLRPGKAERGLGERSRADPQRTGGAYVATETSDLCEKLDLVHGHADGSNGIDSKGPIMEEELVRTYPRRWVMLLLFCFFSLSNAYMWIHLNIIANVVLRYYNESLPQGSLERETAVDWLSLNYMVTYFVFITLGMYILDSFGLRVNNVTGSTFNMLGAWTKCLAVAPGRFPVLLVAQVLCGVGQVFIVSLPPRLAAVWFGPNEVSTATAIGVFGNQLGVAVGFIVPPRIVPNSPDLDDIGHDLGVMFYATAAACTLIVILMLLVFQSRPPHPPSRAQLLQMKCKVKEHYHSSILRLVKSPNFLLMMFSYGIITGCYYAISTLLNYMVLFYFPDEEVNAGNIGLTIILTGIAGSVVAGVWLDRSKYFKSTSVGIFLLCALGMVAFTFTLDQGRIWIVFLTAGLLGFFMTGYLPVGYEFAAEITYPESEATSSGLLTACAMFFGIVMTLGMRAMMNRYGILAANLFVCGMLLMGTIMTALIKPLYNRQEAEKKVMAKVDKMEVDMDDEERG